MPCGLILRMRQKNVVKMALKCCGVSDVKKKNNIKCTTFAYYEKWTIHAPLVQSSPWCNLKCSQSELFDVRCTLLTPHISAVLFLNCPVLSILFCSVKTVQLQWQKVDLQIVSSHTRPVAFQIENVVKTLIKDRLMGIYFFCVLMQ